MVEAIRSVAGDRAGLHEPEFAGREREYVLETIDSGWVSSVGSYVDRFEQLLAEIVGAERAVATGNGTAALHIALLLGGVQPGDEVLTPALTFIATANAVTYCGAIPHFVDVTDETLGLGPAALDAYLDEIGERRGDMLLNRRTGRPIRAVLPMHTFGHPVDLDALLAVCERHGVVLVEDAAESIGSSYKGRHTGTFGRVGAISFNGNKTVTTGGGGAVICTDPEIGRRAKHLTTQAKVPNRWEYIHDEIGYNYRLPNLNAALGCAQLEQLDGFIADKRRLADRYAAAFANVPGVRLFREPSFARSNYWLNVLLLDEPDLALRDEILAATNDAGLMTRPVWRLMHRLPMYSDNPRMPLPVAEALEARIVNIPSSARLGR
ncbi:MAG: LegC family aminotransferase [Chloroflexota bacterium]